MSSKRYYIKRAIGYFSRNGFRRTLYKSLERLAVDRSERSYTVITADEETLRAQREHRFANPRSFSILVPVYETDPRLLRLTLDSVAGQTYGNWELIIADASADGSRQDVVNDLIADHKADDAGLSAKIRYIRVKENKGISANTNVALAEASADYIALLDHDDILEKTALFDIMSAIENRDIKVVYTDEDKVSEDGSSYFDVNRKPDFDPVLLCTNNYICHFFVADTALVRSVGGFRSEYDGAQDHDLVLRCTKDLDREEIIHIPKVLYHWRSLKGSTAQDPSSKLYAYDAGKRAVEDYLNRCGIRAKVKDSPHMGFFELEYDRFEGGRDAFLIKISPDLAPLDPQNTEKMINVMQLPFVGVVTGKIIGTDNKVESAGYDIDDRGNKIASFSGLGRHFSGYMHRADLDRLTGAASPDCMVVRKDAVLQYDPDIKLRQGYYVYYYPRAVFRRKKK
ncbi:MAG: glycosyltransferase [Lachnospiraceae bacterium]|nr:glycosyltransferase [Lachnospiraceae bacterium]